MSFTAIITGHLHRVVIEYGYHKNGHRYVAQRSDWQNQQKVTVGEVVADGGNKCGGRTVIVRGVRCWHSERVLIPTHEYVAAKMTDTPIYINPKDV